jgi:uncharacterized protein
MADFPPVSAFTCIRCGNCCQGEGGIVLTHQDIDRLCAYLHLDRDALISEYVECVSDKLRLRTSSAGWCIFFKDGCAVHPAKPAVCRAWPFFRGNMIDADSWRMAQDACPGINAQAGHDLFVVQGRAYLRDLDPAPSTPTGPNALPDSNATDE